MMEQSLPVTDPDGVRILQVKGLGHRFGDEVALEDVSFRADRGEMLGIVGPDGAGKTTAMRAVLGMLTPDRGTVLWQGQVIDESAARRFGYLPEARGLYPRMTGRENLRFFGMLRGVETALIDAQIETWLGRLGLGAAADEPFERLSTGDAQRMELAATLIHDPELLVLDEPFAGLDPGGVDFVGGILQQQAAGGVTVVLSTSRLELVERLCTALVVINRGRRVAGGRIEDLRGGRRRLRVGLISSSGDWLDVVPGVYVIEVGDENVLLELDHGVSEDAVLDAARGSGKVTHFAIEPASVADIFRQAVSD